MELSQRQCMDFPSAQASVTEYATPADVMALMNPDSREAGWREGIGKFKEKVKTKYIGNLSLTKNFTSRSIRYQLPV